MAQVSTAAARKQISEVINRAAYGKERMILTRRGKEVAAVVPIEDVKVLEALEDRMDLEEARASLAQAKGGRAISWSKLKKELGL